MHRSSRRRIALLFVLGLAIVGLSSIASSVASAHECTEEDPDCHPTPVYDHWRDSYVPLFVNQDKDDPAKRQEAQRWRDEWGCDAQFCAWAKPSGSVASDGQPQSLHAGMAADHSLLEAAHDSEHHGEGEGNHDAHGGALYADVCLSSEEGTSYEGQAGDCTRPEDTQVGVVIMDHLDCPLGCADEYHDVRPLDTEYTLAQMQDSQDNIAEIAADPHTYVCGYPEHSLCP